MVQGFRAYILAIGLAPIIAGASITLTDPTSAGWVPVIFPGSAPEYTGDVQANSIEADIVGSLPAAALNSIYIRYSASSDEWGFRVRLGGDKEDDDTFSAVMWFGLAVQGVGDTTAIGLDVFLQVDTNNGQLSLFSAGNGENISPQTTSIDSTVFWSSPVIDDGTGSANLDWSPVDTFDSYLIGNPAANLDGGNKKSSNNTDHFLTVIFPFNAVASAISDVISVPFDDQSAFGLVAATSNQPNSLNGDLNGAEGGTSSSLTWEDLTALSPFIDASGTVAVPEPAEVAAIFGLAALIWVGFRRKRMRRRA